MVVNRPGMIPGSLRFPFFSGLNKYKSVSRGYQFIALCCFYEWTVVFVASQSGPSQCGRHRQILQLDFR